MPRQRSFVAFLAVGLVFTMLSSFGIYYMSEDHRMHVEEKLQLTELLEQERSEFTRAVQEKQQVINEKTVQLQEALAEAQQLRAIEEELRRMVETRQEAGGFELGELPPPPPPPTALTPTGGLGRKPAHALPLQELQHKYNSVTHIVSHTHWDREWYLPFETFRGRLVRLMDTVMDAINRNGSFKHFHLDGQMIPVDDYAQIRGEHVRLLLQQANAQGKIGLGPWYVQPDEFLVSAEALVRNLQIGIHKAEELGGYTPIGYIPDSFGHIAQMPQMLLGFDINSAVSGRGLETNFGPETFWVSPDGSEVLFIYLKAWYCNGLAIPTYPKTSLESIDSVLAKKRVEASRNSKTKHVLLMNGCDHSAPDPDLPDTIVALQDMYRKKEPQKTVVHSNMEDYVELVRLDLGPKLHTLQRRTGELRADVQHLTNTLSNKPAQKQMNWMLQTYLERWVEPLEALAWRMEGRKYDRDTIWYAWRVLLENHPHDSICGCSAGEVHQEVDMRFTKVRQVVEQMSTYSAMTVARNLPSTSRRSLGDGQTVVIICFPRREVVVVNYFGDKSGVVSRGGGRTTTSGGTGGSLTVVDQNGNTQEAVWLKHNSRVWHYKLPDVGFRQPETTSDNAVAFVVTVPPMGYSFYTIRYPASSSSTSTRPSSTPATRTPVRTATTLGVGGVRSPGARTTLSVGDEERNYLEQRIPGFHEPEREEEVKYGAGQNRERRERPLEQRIPGFHEPDPEEEYILPQPPPPQPQNDETVATLAGSRMENEYLQVELLKGATIQVKHKASGTVWTGLNKLEISSDSGDQYKFRGSAGGTVEEKDVRLEGTYHYYTHSMIKLSVTLMSKNVRMPATLLYILKRHSQRVEIRLEFDNTATNWRLRALFPISACSMDKSFADSQFETISRPPSSKLFQPQLKYLVGYCSAKRIGLGVANRGLYEYQIDTNRLAVTLMRATGAIGDWGTFPVASAQSPGRHAFEMAVIPFDSADANFPFGMVDLEARAFNEKMMAWADINYPGFIPEAIIDMTSDLQYLARTPYTNTPSKSTSLLPTTSSSSTINMDQSLIDIRPYYLVLSSLKKADYENALVLRFFNPFEHDVAEAELRFHPKLRVSKVEMVKLNEKPLDKVTLLPLRPDGKLVMKVPKKKIITLKLS
ncbi:Mannosylglycerate hydrolase [Balamuthia mandrillaris]